MGARADYIIDGGLPFSLIARLGFRRFGSPDQKHQVAITLKMIAT